MPNDQSIGTTGSVLERPDGESQLATEPFDGAGAFRDVMRRVGVLPFDEFVIEHGPGLMRTAYLLTSDEREAEDLLQDCLLQLARRWPKVSSMENPLAYARRVLVRLVVRGSKQRSRRRRELGAATMELPVTPVAMDQFEARDELRAALRQLGPRHRAVLVLRYFHDLTEAQVAEALGVA